MKKLLNNMTVRTSCMLVLLMFTATVVGVSAMGGYAVKYSQDALEMLNKVNAEQKKTLNIANTDLLGLRLLIQEQHRNITTSQSVDEPAFDKIEKQMADVKAVFEKFFAMDFPSRHQPLVEEVEADYERLMNDGLEPQLASLKAGNMKAYAAQVPKTWALNKDFYESAVDYFVTTEKEGKLLYQNFQGTSLALKSAFGAAVVISLILILVVLWGITVKLIRPLDRVVGHFEKMAEGDLSACIERRGNNEIGKLFTALRRMQEELSGTVGKVRHGSQRIHAGSQSIAHGNTDLAARSEQQAASLEETASSMEQLTSTVSQNADNARQASQLAQSASQAAEHGGEVVGQVVDTMREISASSHKVVDIIDVIDSITFQTNILALNASVEAARAGEQGRGFAVVAGEVRNLASRSADAAKEIRGLIEASVERVDAGSQLVDQAGSTTGDIVSAVQRVNDIMGEIAAASQEQSNGIGQVNQAVTEMDHVTQQNACLVQEASSAANALEREADALREAMALFRLADDSDTGSDAVAPLAINGQPMLQPSRSLPVAKQRNKETAATGAWDLECEAL